METKSEFDITNWVPVERFSFGEPSGRMYEMTCRNHRDARYLTKNPYSRNLHLVALPSLAPSESKSPTGECICPFGDLVVNPVAD
jgi:hypothetical protein